MPSTPQQEQLPRRSQVTPSKASEKVERQTRTSSAPRPSTSAPVQTDTPQPSTPSPQHDQPVFKRTPPFPFSARIKLTLSVPDRLQDQLHASLLHAVGKIEDIQLMEEEHEWELIILGIPLDTVQGSSLGIALSGVIVHNHRPFQSVSDFQGTWLRVHAEEHLQQMCDVIIADFDQRYLEPQRATHRKLVDASDQQNEQDEPSRRLQ